MVHVDESAPHAHFQLPAYDLTGHPISETAKRGALRDLQTITAEVMRRHSPGIERGRSKLDRLKAGASPAEVVNRSVAQLHDDLPAEIAAKETELAEVQAKLQTNLDRLAKARAEAATEGEKAEKARKRAEIYEGRVQQAQTEFTAAEARLQTLRQTAQEATERVAVAERQAEAAEARLGPLRAAVAALDAHEASEARRRTQIEAQSTAGNLQKVRAVLRPGPEARPFRAAAETAVTAWLIVDPEARQSCGLNVTASHHEIRKVVQGMDRRQMVAASANMRTKAGFDFEAGAQEIGAKMDRAQNWADLVETVGAAARAILARLARLFPATESAFQPRPAPPAAEPAKELPDDLRAAIRKTGQSGPSGP